MNILVTGGSGFLGRAVVNRLFEHLGNNVIIMDNLDPLCGGYPLADRLGLDVSDYNNVVKVIKAFDIEAIIHLAAYGRNLTCQDFPHTAWNVNVNGTLNVLEAARVHGLKRVVCCSSNIVLSDQPTVYKTTKQACEDLVKLYAGLGVSCMALRPSNIGGAGQSRIEYQPCAFAGLDLSYERDGHFSITGDGTQSRDFVNVRDVARAFELALMSDITGETMDVCSGRQTSINEVAKILNVPVKYIAPRPGDAKILVSDPTPAMDRLRFVAEIGIWETVRESFPSVTK